MTDTKTTGAVLDHPEPDTDDARRRILNGNRQQVLTVVQVDARHPHLIEQERQDALDEAWALVNALDLDSDAFNVDWYVASQAVADTRCTLAKLDRRRAAADRWNAREEQRWAQLRATKYAAEGWDACPDRGQATPGGLLGALAAAGLIALASLTLLLVTSPAEAPTGRPAPAPTATTATPTPDEYTADQLARIIAEERRTP